MGEITLRPWWCERCGNLLAYVDKNGVTQEIFGRFVGTPAGLKMRCPECRHWNPYNRAPPRK